MKKSLLTILPMLLIASSCKVNTEDLTILTPTGAPAVAFYNHYYNENYVTNSSPINIVSSMTDNGSDIVVIDTIKGIDAIKNGSPYKLAANITFGNFYIASTGNDDNETMDKDDVIVSFGIGQTPQKVFELIYGTDYTNIEYVENVSQAAKCLQTKQTIDKSKDVDYVFIAEPVLTQSLKVNTDAKVYANIQEKYTKKTNKGLIQAGVFVKNSTDKNKVNKFLDDLNNDISNLLADSEVLTTTLKDVDNDAYVAKYGIGMPIAKQTISNNNKIGLGFKYASENNDNIKEFCKLFNLEVNDEEIYKK